MNIDKYKKNVFDSFLISIHKTPLLLLKMFTFITPSDIISD